MRFSGIAVKKAAQVRQYLDGAISKAMLVKNFL